MSALQVLEPSDHAYLHDKQQVLFVRTWFVTAAINQHLQEHVAWGHYRVKYAHQCLRFRSGGSL